MTLQNFWVPCSTTLATHLLCCSKIWHELSTKKTNWPLPLVSKIAIRSTLNRIFFLFSAFLSTPQNFLAEQCVFFFSGAVSRDEEVEVVMTKTRMLRGAVPWIQLEKCGLGNVEETSGEFGATTRLVVRHIQYIYIHLWSELNKPHNLLQSQYWV